ncbi:hypothetical protein Sjap_003576 [Stephania japonica]|uniref:FBD domain-containing protein n=1 Tax=Stephania japonica TaxID=461633 RepID=A0AAP0KP16_9MAGN
MEAPTPKKSAIENAEPPDRISDLPDALLHHIFSFLDTRYAVQSSVLSSRFDFLWGSMLHLRFFSNTPNTTSLEKLIHKVLSLRDKYHIKSLHIHSDNDDDVPHVYYWILAAIRRNVREIDICMATRAAIHLPQFLFTCDSLTVLKLGLGTMGEDFPPVLFPDWVDLPNVKLLQFTRVSIDECFAFQLIRSCPSLETLIIVDSELSFEEEFEIVSRKLVHLGVQCRFPIYQRDVSEFKVRLVTPNLKVFRWEDYMVREFVWSEPAKLDQVEFGLVMDEEGRMDLDCAKECKQMQARHMLKLLEAVSNVNSLTLYGCYHLVTFDPSSASEYLSLQYHNLKYLKLETWLSADCLLATLYMLKICPNVKTLSLHRLEDDCLEPNHRCWDEKLSPSQHLEKCREAGSSKLCISHHLKVVEIHGVRGCMIELMLLEILLKGAMVLEKVVICTSEEKSSDGDKGLADFHKKLRALPRASSTVTFVFKEE